MIATINLESALVWHTKKQEIYTEPHTSQPATKGEKLFINTFIYFFDNPEASILKYTPLKKKKGVWYIKSDLEKR